MRSNRTIRLSVLILGLVAAGGLTASASFAQTQGMERRNERRDDRKDGREAGRVAKEKCKDAGGNIIECRHDKGETKRAVKHAPDAPKPQ